MQPSKINLSYIIPTYNKLSYLKTAIANLNAKRKDDEEIVVIDGKSTDGTPLFLQELLDRGEIDRFVSGPEKGLSLQINKGMLMARGELLKIINDDDIYHYDEIQKCKLFMLDHPEIDVLGTNGIQEDGNEYHREEDFLMWKNAEYHPFMIAELGLMMRRSSIPVFGLADTAFLFWMASLRYVLRRARPVLAGILG